MKTLHHGFVALFVVLSSFACKPEIKENILWPPTGETAPVSVVRADLPLRAGIPFVVTWRFEGDVPEWPAWPEETGDLVPLGLPELKAQEVSVTLEPLVPGVTTIPEREFFFEDRGEIWTIPPLELEVGSSLAGDEDTTFLDPESPDPLLVFVLVNRLWILLSLTGLLLLVAAVVAGFRLFRRFRKTPPVWQAPLTGLEKFLEDPPGADRYWHAELFEKLSVLPLLLPEPVSEAAEEWKTLEAEKVVLSGPLYLPPDRYLSDPAHLHDYGCRCLNHFRGRVSL
jgi:hypothetical protein